MKNKVPFLIFVAFFALLIFIFFAAEPSGKQAFFEPVSVTDIEKTDAHSKISEDDIFPFVSDKHFGYYNREGKIVFAKEQENSFSISKNIWTSYKFISPFSERASDSVKAQRVKIFSPYGNEICEIEAIGNIHLKNDRSFVFLYSANTVCEYDTNGKITWAYSMPAVITAFDCNADFVVLGSSDGAVVCLDKSGKEMFNFYPGGSDIQIIYGLAIADNSEYLACLSGLDKQRILLIELNNYHKVIFHNFLEKELRRQATMFFDKTCRYLFSETADGLVILDCNKLELRKTNIDGRLCSYYVKVSKNGFGLLSQKEKTATLSFFDLKCRKFAENSFTCRNSSLLQFENEFFLILDEKLLKFALKRQ